MGYTAKHYPIDMVEKYKVIDPETRVNGAKYGINYQPLLDKLSKMILGLVIFILLYLIKNIMLILKIQTKLVMMI